MAETIPHLLLKQRASKYFFIDRNNQKSHSAKFGEYGGRGSTETPLIVKKSVTTDGKCDGAMSCYSVILVLSG